MNFLRQWRNWIRPAVMVVYAVAMCVALPLMIVEFQVQQVQRRHQAWFIGGMFVLMAVPISVWGILQHLIHYTQPFLQRHIIRIMWMVPVYAVNAWFALIFKDAAIYLDTIRECYEAYVIYNFMRYLLNYLYNDYPELEAEMERKPQIKHLVPFCCFPPWKMGRDLITNCKHGVLQYTVVRPLTTVMALLCEWGKVYDEGDFNFKSAWSYLVIINNISQVWAMYCLILFYIATKEELKPIKPLSKFLCVKAVVFMSFWQAVLIAALVKLKVIKWDSSWVDFDVQDAATGLQDFLICIEMFLAAIAHYYSFSHKPYVDYAAGHSDCCQSFATMWDVSDVRDDVVDHVRHVGKTVTRPLRGRQQRTGTDSERTSLLRSGSESEEGSSGTFLANNTPLNINITDVEHILADQSQGGTVQTDQSQNRPSNSTDKTIQSENRKYDDVTSIDTLDSSVDLSEYNRHRSLTASMNNYAQFSENEEVASLTSRTSLASRQDVKSQDVLVHLDPDDAKSTEDIRSIECAVGKSSDTASIRSVGDCGSVAEVTNRRSDCTSPGDQSLKPYSSSSLDRSPKTQTSSDREAWGAMTTTDPVASGLQCQPESCHGNTQNSDTGSVTVGSGEGATEDGLRKSHSSPTKQTAPVDSDNCNMPV